MSQCLLVILPDLIYFSVWPDMTIRLCQFHIIKAITQWAKSKPKAAKGKKKTSHHGLTDESLPKLLDLFRKAQRARSKQSWKSTHSKSFIKGVHELQREFGCKASVILEYFEKNWWNTWLSECTHYSLTIYVLIVIQWNAQTLGSQMTKARMGHGTQTTILNLHLGCLTWSSLVSYKIKGNMFSPQKCNN